MAEKSKILVIGGTGTIGRYVVKASAELGHPTFALVRKSTDSKPDKLKIIDSFKSLGVSLLYGDIYDHDSLVNAIKQADVVISTVGSSQVPDQVKIIAAIKDAGNVERFLPSEFGTDCDRDHSVEPAASSMEIKRKIRRAIEAEEIPMAWDSRMPRSLLETRLSFSEMDKPKAMVLVREEDIATYIIKAVDDPRTLNKILYMRPPANVLTANEIVGLWEKKIGKTLHKTYLLEDQLLKMIQEASPPKNFMLAIVHSAFVKGDAANYEIEPSFGVEASELYPEIKYTTVDEYLDQFA